MSKSATPTPVTPTRRQLDELEALLQRMLELPVQASDEDEPTTNDPPEPEETPPAIAEVTSATWEGRIIADAGERGTTSSVPPPADYSQPPLTSRNSLWADGISWKNTEDQGRPSPSPGPEQQDDRLLHAKPSAETVQPEPGIFRVLLGWSGLLCLILSLAILLLDWFGWTW